MRKTLLIGVLLTLSAGTFAQISTDNEKLSVMGALSVVGPLLPISSDGIGTDDKAQMLRLYAGLSPGSPPAGGDGGITVSPTGPLSFPLLFGMIFGSAVLTAAAAYVVLKVVQAWVRAVQEIRERRFQMDRAKREADIQDIKLLEE